MRLDDDIWPQVQNHRWKWQMGRVDVVGILWHATRSGIAGRTAAEEYSSTLNWFRSPNNYVDVNNVRVGPGKPWYGGMSHYVIGGGKIAIAVPESVVPRFSAGIHDFRAISVEVGQATRDTPYDPRDIELCRELAQELSSKYGFPLGRLPFVDANNNGWPGEIGHEDTYQGRQQGKSDPSELFWQAYEEDDMNEADTRRIAREEAEAFFAATFRTYLDLAVNGGPSGFTDSEGKPLPLIHDRELVKHLDTPHDIDGEVLRAGSVVRIETP